MTKKQKPPSPPDLGMIKAWADYSKARFASAEARIAEYRGWARQLIAAIGVVIGLEVTIVTRLALDTKILLPWELRAASLACLFVALAVQFVVLRHLLLVGYHGEHLFGPEAPTRLADYLADKDEREAHRVIGAYYAKSFDHFHELAERLGKQVGDATVTFQWTLLPVLLGVLLLPVGPLWSPPASDSYEPMATEGVTAGGPVGKPSSQNTTSADTPAPPTNPLVVTPTPGQVETHGATPTEVRK